MRGEKEKVMMKLKTEKAAGMRKLANDYLKLERGGCDECLIRFLTLQRRRF